MFEGILDELLAGKISNKDALKSAFMKGPSIKRSNKNNSTLDLLIRFRKKIERAVIKKQEKDALIAEIKKILEFLER